MQCFEIFHAISPKLATEILTFLDENEKDAYKGLVSSLAPNFHLRPVFVMRKPKPERHQWVTKALSRKSSDTYAANVLQFWLSDAKKDLLKGFLDSLEIEHDGNGMVDELPDCPPKEKIEAAIDTLLATEDGEAVGVYLNAFQGMDIAEWPVLQEILESDPRLALGKAAA